MSMGLGTADDHEHTWRLVSVETECGGVEVRECLCTTCAAVHLEGG